MKVEIISATRLSRENFAKSALSQSLQRLAYDPRVFMRDAPVTSSFRPSPTNSSR
jgi:hypothetical protein